MGLSRFAIVIVLAAVLYTVQSCDGASRGAAGFSGAHQDVLTTTLTGVSSPSLPDLPPPWTLLNRRLEHSLVESDTHHVAYAGSDAVKSGQDYDDSLPQNNASKVGVYARLSPSWVDSYQSKPSDLAYCTYMFHLPGYDGLPRVYALWQDAPSTFGSCWFGLSNWERDRWDWRPNTNLGYAELPSMTPYLTPAGDLLLVVLRIGTDSSEHWRVRLGGLPPSALLTAWPTQGSTPLTTLLDASNSSPAEGFLAKFEWDAEGDGVFEADTGTSPSYSVTYSEPGIYHAAVRVTNSLMATNTAVCDVNSMGGWQHTWGQSAEDTANGIVIDPFADVVYTVGSTGSLTKSGTRDILVCRWTAAGQLLWAKTFDSGGDDCAYDACPSTGKCLIIVGAVETDGDRDGLVQRWTMDGQPLWSLKLGGSGSDKVLEVFTPNADSVIVAGDTTSISATTDIFIAGLAQDNGYLGWVQTGDTGADDHATSLAQSTTLDDSDSACVAIETVVDSMPSICIIEYLANTDELVGSRRLGDSLASLRCGQVYTASDDAGMLFSVISGVIDEGTGYKPFVVHLDQTGECAWGKRLNTPAPAMIEDMVVDELDAGGITLVGAIPGGDALERVLMVNFSPLNGELIGAASWGVAGSGAGCHSVIRIYGTGLILTGSSVDASGTWEQLAGAVDDVVLSYSDIAVTSAAAAWPTLSVTGSLANVTSQGVLDTGAGAQDSLVMFALAPTT